MVRILGPNGSPISHGPSRTSFISRNQAARAQYERLRDIQARYDAAIWTEENRKSWALVDMMSARAANSKEVRFRLRTRARYEVANNSYARGIVTTLANDTIGTGPRLQMLTDDHDLNRAIERAFMEWARKSHLASKLRTMRMSLAQDGEAFALLITNYILPTAVQLDLLLIEADQVSTPFLNPIDPLAVDGIRYDLEGNPILYSILRRHPGDIYQIGLLADYYDARSVLHWFRKDRPGQRRGLPDIMPALDLFNQLRRYTLAVLAAAETAADFAAVLESQLPPEIDENGNPIYGEPFEHIDIERRMMMTLPNGYKMSQFRAEQPTTTFEMFEKRLLMQIGRCLHMPYSKVSGDYSNDNYATGRLAHQTYHKSIHVDQSDIELTLLDRILTAWIEEASLSTNLIGDRGSDPLEGWPHQWFWDGFEHVDPLKEASAQEKRLANHTTTLADEYARRGQDWEVQIRQRAKELALMSELGIPLAPAAPGMMVPPVPEPAFVPDEEEDESDTTPEEGD